MHLIVEGKNASHRFRVALTEGSVFRLGRAASCDVTVPFDLTVSREHANLCWKNGRLRVTCLPNARNSLLYQDAVFREICIAANDSFVIGSTKFAVGLPGNHDSTGDTVEVPAIKAPFDSDVPKANWAMQSYSPGELQHVEFHNAAQQIQLLSRLPDLISDAHSDADLGHALSGLLIEAIPQAVAVAVIRFDVSQIPDTSEELNRFPKPLTMRVQTRDDFVGRFRPSRRVIQQALQEKNTVLHFWRDGAPETRATISPGLDWAVCAPVHSDACRGWCMYLSGTGTRHGALLSEEHLAPDVRFIELVAQFIGSVRQVRMLQEEKTRLSAFFSPKVVDSLALGNGHNLEPAERDITVLFCDVRGFSRKAEQNQENLVELLSSVRHALGLMVDGILEFDGTIADFQGDAALGFWGWPVALEYGPIPACRAALAIQRRFRAASLECGSLLKDYAIGIGIAHGRAVAGQIGTEKQSKVGVFGPVVNQCARLESFTKQFGVTICIDAATAEFVDRYLPDSEGRLRSLARVRPHGMDNAVDVHELLPPVGEAPEMTWHTIRASAAARDAIVCGQWSDALEVLRTIPDDDGCKQFLLDHMSQFDNIPPGDWDGAFQLSSK